LRANHRRPIRHDQAQAQHLTGVMGRIRDEPESSTSKRQRTTTKGTIVRLRMHNFMSYSDAELFADPCKLNCIIGPNGSVRHAGVAREAQDPQAVSPAADALALGRRLRRGSRLRGQQDHPTNPTPSWRLAAQARASRRSCAPCALASAARSR